MRRSLKFNDQESTPKTPYFLRSSGRINDNDLFSNFRSRRRSSYRSYHNGLQSIAQRNNNNPDNPDDIQDIPATSSGHIENDQINQNQSSSSDISNSNNGQQMRIVHPTIRCMSGNQNNDVSVDPPVENPQHEVAVLRSFAVNEFVVTKTAALSAWCAFREKFSWPTILAIPLFIGAQIIKFIVCAPSRIYRYFTDPSEHYHITNMRASCEMGEPNSGQNLFMDVTLYHPVKRLGILWWLIPIAILAYLIFGRSGSMIDEGSDQYKQIAGLLRSQQGKLNDLSHSGGDGSLRSIQARQEELASQIEQLRKTLMTAGSGGSVNNAALQSLVDKIERVERKLESKLQNGGGGGGDSGGGWFSSVGFGDGSVQDVISKALEVYTADKIGMADYALESAGGSIVGTRCSYNFDSNAATMYILGIPIFRLYHSARTIIQPNTLPGECWAFKGSHARVVIKLATSIYVKAVTIDHVNKQITLMNSIDSAPRDFAVKGLKSEYDYNGILLGNFTYGETGPSIQTFTINSNDCQSSMCRPYNLVELEVYNNHGNPHFTCVYRFRVHGTPVQIN